MENIFCFYKTNFRAVKSNYACKKCQFVKEIWNCKTALHNCKSVIFLC